MEIYCLQEVSPFTKSMRSTDRKEIRTKKAKMHKGRKICAYANIYRLIKMDKELGEAMKVILRNKRLMKTNSV